MVDEHMSSLFIISRDDTQKGLITTDLSLTYRLVGVNLMNSDRIAPRNGSSSLMQG